MISSNVSYAHSAKVSAALVVDGRRIPLSKISPELLFPAERVSLAPGIATVELHIDGKLQKWDVRILHHVVPFDDEVAIRPV